MSTSKIETLWWVNREGSFHGGISFYSPQTGEFKLILDVPKMTLYLRAVGSKNDEVLYSVLSPVFIRGKFSHKVRVGHGYSGAQTKGDIHIKLGAHYPNILVMPVQRGA